MIEFRMPSLGADMAAGTLVEWLKKPGETVKRGDIVAVVETQKGAIEIEIFDQGIIDALIVQPGRKVPVGAVLAHVRGSDEPPATRPIEAAAAMPQVGAPVETREPRRPRHAAPADARLRISPYAARRAVELGVDPKSISGTGPMGAITAHDVDRAGHGPARAQPIVPSPIIETDRERTSGRFDAQQMRAAIAAAMTRSKREIPHYYVATTIDLERAQTWLWGENQKRPITERLLPAVLLIKAVALSLREVPELNGVWEGNEARRSIDINVGWAIALRGGGLIAPALRGADKLSLDELMRILRDLVQRARSGGLRASELSAPTITITSLGETGVEHVLGVIIPPQLAMVGFGRIVVRPWVAGNQIAIRRVIEASLAADHRASDGHRGALFLQAVDRLLQEPEKL